MSALAVIPLGGLLPGAAKAILIIYRINQKLQKLTDHVAMIIRQLGSWLGTALGRFSTMPWSDFWDEIARMFSDAADRLRLHMSGKKPNSGGSPPGPKADPPATAAPSPPDQPPPKPDTPPPKEAGAKAAIKKSKADRTPDEIANWQKTVERIRSPSSKPHYEYENRVCGPDTYTLEGGGVEFDADGLDGTTILEAKFVKDDKASPYIPGSTAPVFLHNEVTDKLEKAARAGFKTS
jgi:hypothetical protein